MTHKDLKSIINKAQMKSAIGKSKNMSNDEVKNNWRRLATAFKGYK